jgi:DNA-binding response OmpR family regulator
MTKKKILIADDEPDVSMLTSLRLEKLGYEVLTAINCREAFDTIRDKKPDLVLLDLIMPIMFGTELCKRVKKDEKLKHIPIILFTAHGDIMTAEKAKSMGADDYIVKPFDAEELVNKIERILTEKVAL